MFVSAKCRARGWNLVQLGLDVINGSLDVVVFLDSQELKEQQSSAQKFRVVGTWGAWGPSHILAGTEQKLC